MAAVPIDGWCIQVFHLADSTDPLVVLEAISAGLGAAATAYAPPDSAQVVVETLDEPGTIDRVERIVRRADRGAERVHLSHGDLDRVAAV
ncbi:MAG: hypothetical protein PGN07_07800 [Aeromicrobium erythreum]